MQPVEATKHLYDRTASRWVRDTPLSLSDFTGRHAVLEMCDPVAGLEVLDLGCGEGYCTRALMRAGAARVEGLDVSEGMVEQARAKEAKDRFGIRYHVGSATSLAAVKDASVDLVTAVFLFNYLDVTGTELAMGEAFRVLRPGGRFVFAVPHPCFPFIRPAAPPFFFRTGGAGYFSAKNNRFPGRIWKLDGSWLDVQLCHKTLDDYFLALSKAGFRTLPVTRELRVTKEHIERDPAFFGPISDVPLHLAMAVAR